MGKGWLYGVRVINAVTQSKCALKWLIMSHQVASAHFRRRPRHKTHPLMQIYSSTNGHANAKGDGLGLSAFA